MASRAIHDDFVVVEIHLEATQVSVIDAQHTAIQVEAQYSFQLTNCMHLHSDPDMVTPGRLVAAT